MATAGVLYFIIFFMVALHSFHGIARADYAPFDYFKLVLEWPPAVCNRARGRTCVMTPLPNDFSIHGLWPEVFSGPFPMNCPGRDYETFTETEILAGLNQLWPNFVYGEDDNQVAWAYQWIRHGKCASLWFFQLSYFDLAVEMRQQLGNILGHLEANGIVRGGSYLPVDIRTVVSWLTGRVPSIACTFDRQGRIQLTEVQFCYNTNGNIMDCLPNRLNRGCTDPYVYFPF